MPSTATMVARSTGPAIRTRPPAHSTSTTPPTPSPGGRGVSTGEGSTSGTKAGSGGRSADCSCCRRSRRHRNRRLGVIPCRRATEEIELVVRRASSTMARFSQAAQDRRVLATTVCAKALGPDMSTIQVYPTDPYRSHPHPSPTRRPRPDAYLVSDVPDQLPRSRADAAGPWGHGRPHNPLPLDPSLCAGAGEADPTAPADVQWLVAGRRDVRQGQGALDVPRSRRRQPGPDH